MQLSVVYPESREDFAGSLRQCLQWHTRIQITWISTTSESFTEDLDQPGDLILCLDAALLAPLRRPAREIWAPLLEFAPGSRRIALFSWGSVTYPSLLSRHPQAAATHRNLLSQIGLWLHSLPAAPPLPELLNPLIDNPTLIEIDGDDTLAASLAEAALPWFESVRQLPAHQRAQPLLEAVLAEIIPDGRTLYILTGYSGPLPSLPSGASLLRIFAPAPAPPANAMQHALQLIPLIPTHPGQPLPFSTFEFEQLLPSLFSTNWAIAERLAQRAGAFFRLNHRVAEALWLYRLFGDAARRHGQPARAADCDSEISWLEAGGARKQQFLHASQSAFDF